jgi:hypothetical protein
MRQRLGQPVLILTADADWASDACIAALLVRIGQREHPPTIFATNASPELASQAARGRVDVGLHPNFRPHSTHGGQTHEVFDHFVAQWPSATAFRSHCFMDGSPISLAAVARGMVIDCNSIDFLKPEITPHWHYSGLWRAPTFWEDDVHWSVGAVWDFDRFEHYFMTPGLKVVNVHPFVQAFNCDSGEGYERVKHLTATATPDDIASHRHGGPGAADFLDRILEWAERHSIARLSVAQLYAQIEEEFAHVA